MGMRPEPLLPLLRKNFLVQWIVFCLAFLTVAGTIFYYLHGEYQAVERREGERLSTLVRVVDMQISRQLDAVHKVLMGIRASVSGLEGVRGPRFLSGRFKELRDAIPGVRTLLVTDATGTILASNRDEIVGQAFRPNEDFEDVRLRSDSTVLHVSRPFQTDSGVFAIDLMLMTAGPGGEFAGIASATLLPDFFTPLPASVLYAPDMWAAIAHGDGLQLLMVPDREGMAGLNLAQPGSFFSRHRESGRAESLMTGLVYATGEQRIMALHTVRPARVPMDKPLVVAVGRNWIDIHSEWHRDARMNGVSFLLGSALASFGLYLFQRREWMLRRSVEEVTASLKSSEETLRESEARYRSLVESLPTVTYTAALDEESTTTYVSPQIEKLLGFSQKDYMDDPNLWDKSLHPDDRERVLAEVARCHASGDPFASQYRMITRDGSVRWFSDSASLVRGKDGEPLCLQGVMLDLTEAKQMEIALLASEDRYRSLIYAMPVALYTCDDQGRITFFNEAAGTLWGRGPGIDREIWGDSWKAYSPDGTPMSPEEDPMARSLREGRPARGQEILIERPDGSRIHVLPHPELLRDRTGQVIGAVNVLVDITEIRQAEKKFSLAFRNAPYGLTITRAVDGRFLEANDTLVAMSGYGRDELLAGTSLSLGLWVDENERRRVVKDLQNGKKIIGEEHRFRKKNGETLIGLFFADVIQLDNELCILSSIGDVTDLRRAEAERERLREQFSQAQKMESVGRLAGGVAHDFNNMLSIILGYTAMAMEEAAPSSTLFADLEEVRKAAERSANLTRQLLAFARKQTADPKVLDLNETVAGMLKMLQRLIGEDIDLSWGPGARTWPVLIDPSQIDQILANLCINARDAITGVGKLTIGTENVTFDKSDGMGREGFVAGEYVLLVVSDNGCGMDPETLSSIFEPFFTTKPVGKGTGLGLATVYGIVRQNKGFINVYSEPGLGTTFRIYLPRHQSEKVPGQKEESRPSVLSGHETVLLVEDDPSVLRMTERMLQRQGYRVLAAGTPNEALRMAEEHSGTIHLLMTDVVMPEMNGLDLSREVLSRHPDLKLLFVSGYTADIIARHGVLEKGIHFVQKPLSMHTLADKLREVLGGDDR